MIVKIKQPESNPAEPVLELELRQDESGDIGLYGNDQLLTLIISSRGCVFHNIELTLTSSLAGLRK